MERSLYISKYRNIGLKKDTKLILNHSLTKGEMGNLVILVGANNAGKSNVLDALRTISTNKFLDKDVTNLSFDLNDQKPSLALVASDELKTYSYTLNFDKTKAYTYPGCDEKQVFTFNTNLNELNYLLDKFKERFNKGFFNKPLVGSVDKVIELINQANPNLKQIELETIQMMKEFLAKVYESNTNRKAWEDFKKEYYNYIFIGEFSEFEKRNNKAKELNTKFNEEFGMDFIPNIINYKEERITNSMITSSIKDLENNDFFLKLFNRIGLSIAEVNNAYNIFNLQKNKGVLRTLEQTINEKLESLSADFNHLYFINDDKYRFEVSVESNAIFFLLFRGTKDINLDYQSTGFRWFFDLYFNLLTKSSLKPGDILIMDEPATNLHVRGQVELRKFLKDFAIKNDLTIVIATHSPFLVDMDNLDELRCIVNVDNVSTIVNNFTSYDPTDPDSLAVIKDALTIDRNVLVNPDSQVIFVDSIATYNYMLAFKKFLKVTDDVTFIPIGSLGEVNDPDLRQKQIKISKELIKIRKHNPILLTNSDEVSLSMKELNSNDSSLRVICLKDINDKFSDIESLFTYEDLLNAHLLSIDGHTIKDNVKSSLVKDHIINYSFNANTIKNFEQVYDYLEIEYEA